MGGYGDGRFGPENNVTRQDLTVMLNRFANFAGVTLSNVLEYEGFTDDDAIADYAREAVEAFYAAVIVGGYPDGSFKPEGTATRAEFAAMLQRFLSQ